MISTRPNFHLLKVVLEAQTAHAIHTGYGDTLHDSLIVRDANGLPTLSGTTLAGILRHKYQQHFGQKKTEALFGYALGSEGQSSWLNIAWGLVHNSQNIPQEGLLSAEQLSDPILERLLDEKIIVRQRVKLNERGTSHDTGKFDVTLVPAGTRYTTWISYWCDGTEQSQQQWRAFIHLLMHQPLRIGQGTRNGYGLFQLLKMYQANWDLSTSKGQHAYIKRSRKRASNQDFTEVILQNNTDTVSAVINLSAEAGWRIGGGEKYIEENDPEENQQRLPDLLPMHECKIEWQDDQATFEQKLQYLLPATAIKGALRHRIAYHYNCLTGVFAEESDFVPTDENIAVQSLFGYTTEQNAQAGVITLNDIYLSEQCAQTMVHNKIDRYTGGVVRGALFSEQVLWQSQIEVRLDVIAPHIQLDPVVKRALALSLDDLAQGWLPLGAAGSRGLGVFIDQTGLGAQWSDQQHWIEAGEK